MDVAGALDEILEFCDFAVPIADFLVRECIAMANELLEVVDGAVDSGRCGLGEGAVVDKVLEVVDGVGEGAGACEFAGLMSFIVDLCGDAVGLEGGDGTIGLALLLGKTVQGVKGDVVGDTDVVGEGGSAVALVGSVDPFSELAEPCAEILVAAAADGLGLMDEADALDDFYKLVSVEDSSGASSAVVVSGTDLAIEEMRIHVGVVVEEPSVKLSAEGVVVLLIACDAVGHAEVAEAYDELE